MRSASPELKKAVARRNPNSHAPRVSPGRCVLWTLLALVPAGCRPNKTAAPAEQEPTPAAPEVAAPSVEPEPAVRLDGGVDVVAAPQLLPGRAYFGMEEGPVIELSPDGSTRELEGRKFPSTEIARFVVGRDGQVYALTRLEGMLRVDATGLTPVLESAREAAAVSSTGTIWAYDYKHLIRAEGDLIDKFDLPTKSIDDIAVDASDRVWVSAGNELFRRDGESWKKVQLHDGKLFSFRGWTLATHPGFDGVYASCRSAISRVAPDGSVTQVGRLEPAPESSLSDLTLAFSAASAGIVSREDGRIFVFPFDGDELGLEPFDAAGILLDAAAVDDRGRAWLATPSTFSVIDLTGESPPVSWEQGEVPVLAGRISAIAVLGAGPSLPELKRVEKRTITLSVMDAAPEEDDLLDAITAEGEEPAALALVEVCRAEHDNLLASTPCEGSPSRVAGETDANGNVDLKLAPGPYTAAVQTQDGWYRLPLDVSSSPGESTYSFDLTHAGWWMPKPTF